MSDRDRLDLNDDTEEMIASEDTQDRFEEDGADTAGEDGMEDLSGADYDEGEPEDPKDDMSPKDPEDADADMQETSDPDDAGDDMQDAADPDDDLLDLDEGKVYSDDDSDDETGGKRRRINLNLVLLAAILAVALFCVVRIMLWNRGVKISFDPNEDTSQYDTEPMDSILPMDPKNLEGHEDDGRTTILFLGNSPLMAGGESGSIADITVSTLNSKGRDAEAICAPISFSTLSCVNDRYDPSSYADDAVALPNLVDSLVSGDFSIQKTDLEENHADSTSSGENLEKLSTVDMDKVDVLCLFYDGNDYFYGRQLISNGERDSVEAALNYSLGKFQENYPWIRIILMTPYYRPGVDPEGNTFDPDTTVLNIEALPMYVLQEVKTGANRSISVVDNYYGSINGSNYQEYLDGENNLTEKGVEKLASRFVYALTYYDN